MRSSDLGWFGLQTPPFSKEIGDDDLWLPTSKAEVIDELADAIEARATVLLTGEPGVGKTCVLRALRRRLSPDVFRLTYCHKCARLRLGKENANAIAETLHWNPLREGSPAHRPVKAGPQPEASLARRWTTSDVKRRQRARGPCDSASKCKMSGRPTLFVARKATSTRWKGGDTQGPDAEAPSGSPSTAREQGFSRNRGDPVISRASEAAGATQRSVCLKKAGSRSVAIVAMKWGNLPKGPRGAKRGTGTWNRWRER